MKRRAEKCADLRRAFVKANTARIALLDEVKRLNRELKSALGIIESNQDELARLRHLVAHPDFNLPAAIAIVKEHDEWREMYQQSLLRLSEIEARLPKIGEPYFVDDAGFPRALAPHAEEANDRALNRKPWWERVWERLSFDSDWRRGGPGL